MWTEQCGSGLKRNETEVGAAQPAKKHSTPTRRSMDEPSEGSKVEKVDRQLWLIW